MWIICTRQFIVFFLISAVHSIGFAAVSYCGSLVESQSVVEIRVARFGAVGDGKVDDGDAIRATLAAAVKASADNSDVQVRVSFDKDRVYYVGPWDERWEALPLVGGKNIIIDGKGCELRVHPKNMAFSILRCKNVILRNFKIDYSPLPFTQGEVCEIDQKDGTFIWKLEDGYPVPADMDWVRANGTNFDHGVFVEPPPGTDPTHYWVYVEEVNPIGGRSGYYKIVPSGDWGRDVVRKNVRVGERFWFHLPYCSSKEFESRFEYDKDKCVSAPSASIQIRYSPDCIIENIDNYCSPRMGVRFDGCDNLIIRNVRIIRKPGTTRLSAGNSDGIHGRTRKGPLIENCVVEANGDDEIALGNMAHKVMHARSADTLEVLYTDILWNPSWLSTGDTLVFWDPTAGKVLCERRITKCVLNGHLAVVKLSGPVPGVQPMDSFAEGDTDKDRKVTLAFQKPQKPAVVRGCKMGPSLKEGIIGANGWFVIEDNYSINTAYGIDLQGVLVEAKIRRNKINNPWPFAIGVIGPHIFTGSSWTVDLAKSPMGANIIIEDNEINIIPRGVLPISDGINVQPYASAAVRNNKINVSADVSSKTKAVLINGCGSTVISGNKIDDKRPAVDDGVIILKDVSREKASVKDNQIKTQPGVTDVYFVK